ncbi:MAG: CYTH domain-containing protein [Patescibacteria group bacterium]
MNIEFEATFTGIDKEAVRATLAGTGATCVRPESMMRRTVFNPPIDIPGGWMRVRDEGEKVTMSLKVVNGTSIEDQKEIQLVVDDFDSAVELLSSIGAEKKAYQETLRELWTLDGAEITIDTWPGLRPFVEVEAADELIVRKVSEALGFDYATAKFCEVSTVYQEELGIPPEVMKNQMPIITFEHPPVRYV